MSIPLQKFRKWHWSILRSWIHATYVQLLPVEVIAQTASAWRLRTLSISDARSR
jgi:hypothetical protein